jgi:hypothetical protein
MGGEGGRNAMVKKTVIPVKKPTFDFVWLIL